MSVSRFYRADQDLLIASSPTFAEVFVSTLTPSTTAALGSKSYIDAAIATSTNALDFKESCRVATTANIVLGTALISGQTIDGIVLAAADRVLVKDQSDTTQNGIYVAHATLPSRATDFDEDNEVTAQATTYVSEGTASENTNWVVTSGDPIDVGTDAIVWARYDNGAISATNGITRSGNTLSFNLAYDPVWTALHTFNLGVNCDSYLPLTTGTMSFGRSAATGIEIGSSATDVNVYSDLIVGDGSTTANHLSFALGGAGDLQDPSGTASGTRIDIYNSDYRIGLSAGTLWFESGGDYEFFSAGSRFALWSSSVLRMNNYDTLDAVDLTIGATTATSISIGASDADVTINSHLFIDAPGASAHGPHISMRSTGTDPYDIMQLLCWQHSNAHIMFDASWNGSAFISSSATSNYEIYKSSTQLLFRYKTGVNAGLTFNWDTFMTHTASTDVVDISGALTVDAIDTSTATTLTLASATATAVTLGAADIAVTIPSELVISQPAGCFIRETSAYTTVADASSGIELLIPLTEVADPSAWWSMNSDTTNGHWQYTGSTTRKFTIEAVLSVSTDSGGASSLEIGIDAGGGTFLPIGDTATHYFSGTTDDAVITIKSYYDTPQNKEFRILITSSVAAARYTVDSIQITMSQMM